MFAFEDVLKPAKINTLKLSFSMLYIMKVQYHKERLSRRSCRYLGFLKELVRFIFSQFTARATKIKESSGAYTFRVNVSTSFCFLFACLLSVMDFLWMFSSSHPAMAGGVIDQPLHPLDNCGFNKRLYIKYILPWTHAIDKCGRNVFE